MENEKIIKECYWICNKCGKEHKLKTLFCDECGEARPKIRKSNTIIKKVISKNILYYNIKLIDWIIMATAFVMLLICVAIGFYDESKFNVCFLVTIMLNLFLIIIAFIRLIACKAMKLWQRTLSLFITILFNPFVAMIILMVVGAVFTGITLSRKIKNVNKIELAKACAEIASKPWNYKKKYYDDFSELPEFIEQTKPVYVWINDGKIMVALMGGVAHYGWDFVRAESNIWNLQWYDDVKSKILISNIVINTNTGEVIIPQQLMNIVNDRCSKYDGWD